MERLSQCLPLLLSPSPPSTKTRGMHLHKCAGACLCSSFPLSLKALRERGTKGERVPLGAGVVSSPHSLDWLKVRLRRERARARSESLEGVRMIPGVGPLVLSPVEV